MSKFSKTPPWQRIAFVAGCVVCLLAGGSGFFLDWYDGSGVAASPPAFQVPTTSVYEEPTKPCDAKGNDRHGPENDADDSLNWEDQNHTIPCDGQIYTVVAVIVDVNSASRQTQAASGSGSGSVYGSGGSVYGSHSSSYQGAIIDGKAFLDVHVLSVSPPTNTLPDGSYGVLKATDTKAAFYPPNAKITLTCRRQFEATAAIINGEKYTEQQRADGATWEFDYCRLQLPGYTLVAPEGTPAP
jgi:hypothetical protein